jgi:hypothetical protein
MAPCGRKVQGRGKEPTPMTADKFEAYFKEDVLSTAKLMQQIGIKPQD